MYSNEWSKKKINKLDWNPLYYNALVVLIYIFPWLWCFIKTWNAHILQFYLKYFCASVYRLQYIHNSNYIVNIRRPPGTKELLRNKFMAINTVTKSKIVKTNYSKPDATWWWWPKERSNLESSLSLHCTDTYR